VNLLDDEPGSEYPTHGGGVELSPRSRLPAVPVPAFDRFAERVAERLGAPVALVTMVDVDGQALPGAFGLAEPWLTERWTP
jgi:hypothetical protein